MSYKGDTLIAVGIIIILATLYMGYELYLGIQKTSAQQALAPSVGGSVNASIGDLSTNLSNTINSSSYSLVEVVILFLFASIGYKVAAIGIKINDGETHQQDLSDEKEDFNQKRK